MLSKGSERPPGVHGDLRVHEILGHHRGLRELPEVEDHALPLRDEVEVAAEGVCEPARSRDRTAGSHMSFLLIL